MRKVNSLVGSPIERVEDLRFLRGRGRYVDDLAPDGLLHAVILRSSVAHGRFRAIDTTVACSLPGVCAVITAADIVEALGRVPTIPLRQEPLPAFKPYEQPVIAHLKVRYVGEPVAVVVAESAAIAEDALEAIVLDIESLPAVADRATARANSSVLFEAKEQFIKGVTGGNIAYVSIVPSESDWKVRVNGNTAIVNGVAAVNVIDTGKDLKIKIRYTTIHTNRGGGWQMQAWQATRFPQ